MHGDGESAFAFDDDGLFECAAGVSHETSNGSMESTYSKGLSSAISGALRNCNNATTGFRRCATTWYLKLEYWMDQRYHVSFLASSTCQRIGGVSRESHVTEVSLSFTDNLQHLTVQLTTSKTFTDESHIAQPGAETSLRSGPSNSARGDISLIVGRIRGSPP